MFHQLDVMQYMLHQLVMHQYMFKTVGCGLRWNSKKNIPKCNNRLKIVIDKPQNY